MFAYFYNSLIPFFSDLCNLSFRFMDVQVMKNMPEMDVKTVKVVGLSFRKYLCNTM